MFKRCGLLILVIGVVLVFQAGISRAWMVGKFQVPAKKAPAGRMFTDSVTGMEFVWVPGGCFQMGSPSGEEGRNDDEGPVHKVCVDGFWMGKYEVTQGQWQKIMGKNPSMFKKGDNYPVEQVSWNDCQEFIKKLNRQSSKTFRLPSEAEWEYACRSGGKVEKYSGGNDAERVAWYRSTSGGYTHPVGTKATNGFGLYDMSGNVREWCADWYAQDHYGNSFERNPQGPSLSSERVSRGGCWDDGQWYIRAATRFGFRPDTHSGYLGFRLVYLGQ